MSRQPMVSTDMDTDTANMNIENTKIITKKLLVGFVLLISLVFISLIFIGVFIYSSSASYYTATVTDNGISIREFPYPYKAALSITNDIDQTETAKEFLDMVEFLNTNNETYHGKGLGLEIGNSFFGKWENNLFAMASGNPVHKEIIIKLIKLGYIDSIHSYNTVNNRQEILAILDTLNSYECKIPIWINHSSVSNNLGYHEGYNGDNVNSKIFHSDRTFYDLNTTFIWQHAVTGIVGQARPFNLFTFFEAVDTKYLSETFINYTLYELTKYIMAHFGVKQYKMRKYNELVSVTNLDDGRPVFEFMRCNYGIPNIWDCADLKGIGSSIRPDIVDKLIAAGGYSLIYTHFGKNDSVKYIPENTKNSLTYLSKKYHDGEIYITTTEKLLNYYVNKKYLTWSSTAKNDSLYIRINNISDPVRGNFVPELSDLQGLTFYTPFPERTIILIGERKVNEFKINSADNTNIKSISLNENKLQGLVELLSYFKGKQYY